MDGARAPIVIVLNSIINDPNGLPRDAATTAYLFTLLLRACRGSFNIIIHGSFNIIIHGSFNIMIAGSQGRGSSLGQFGYLKDE